MVAFWLLALMVREVPGTSTCVLNECTPTSVNFEQLHDILQVAFGWTSSHAYIFEVNTIANGPSKFERCGPAPTYALSL